MFNTLNNSGGYVSSNFDLRNSISVSSATTFTPNTVTFNAPINFSLNQNNQIMQNKVAVFQVVRDENDKIIKTEFIKELWVETKNGQTVDFAVARDRDLADYEADELIIKTILTVTF